MVLALLFGLSLCKVDLVTVVEGDLPIILSAPHGGTQPVPGCALRKDKTRPQFATVVDTRADRLVALTRDELFLLTGKRPWLVTAQFARTYIDANRPAEDAYEDPAAKPYYDAYHSALRHAVDSVKHGLLVDVHGQGGEKDGIYRGTRQGESMSYAKKQFGYEAFACIPDFLAHHGYRMIPSGADEKETKFDGGYIVDHYGSHHQDGIDALQLEFGPSFRTPDRIEQTAKDLAAAIAAYYRKYLAKTTLVSLLISHSHAKSHLHPRPGHGLASPF